MVRFKTHKHVDITLDERIIAQLDQTSKKANISKSGIVANALLNYFIQVQGVGRKDAQ